MIVRTRNRGQIELRAFSLADLTRYGYTGLRGFSPTIGEDQARGVPALHRAARLRAEALGSLRLCCWSGYGPERVKRETVWQSRLFERADQNEWQTRFTFWETVGESLAWRNKAYIWKNVDPITGRVVDWYALHPDQVMRTGPDTFQVKVGDGFLDPVGGGRGRYDVDDTTILFIRGFGDGGSLEPRTPIEIFRDAMTSPVLRQRHEGKMWARGASIQAAVEFPIGVKQSDAQEWKDVFKRTYQGADGDTIAVVGGGAQIKPIGMTAVDAQFVDMAKLTVYDAARIMGVPANLLGTQLERAVPNLEQDLATWLRFGLAPECERIEAALEADEELFSGAQTYPQFDTSEFVRGDLATEAAAIHSFIQDGVLTPDEARAKLGYPPHRGGIGATPQMTPVGGAPNPSPNPMPNDNSGGDGGY